MLITKREAVLIVSCISFAEKESQADNEQLELANKLIDHFHLITPKFELI